MEKSVSVNYTVCEMLARQLALQKIPEDREELLSLNLPPPLIGNFFLLVVSICHQTSAPGRLPLMGVVHGKVQRGWDYLFQRMLEIVEESNDLLDPLRWIHLSSQELQDFFSDVKFGNRLTDPEGRCRLIQDLGEKMRSSGWVLADDIFKRCEGRVGTGQPNLLDLLMRFRAYADPVKKKSLYFLSLMRNNSRWQYPDNASLGPPVDYHEVRGHLRIGTVSVNDTILLKKLRDRTLVTADEDVALRQAVYNAIMLISELSGLRNPSQLHYLFWNVFRSICLRQEPQCFQLDPSCDLPQRYRHLTVARGKKGCPFATICGSAGIHEPVLEHVFETDYY
jgi:hypothetical protein